jgi:DNA-binding NarL/FixJ family response regulator
MAGGFVRSFLPDGTDVTKFYRAAARRLPAESGTYIEQVLLSRRSLAPSQALSVRELEVLRLLSDGASNQEIAAHLFVTVSTVKKHISSILRKLNAPNRTSAIVRARELGIIS